MNRATDRSVWRNMNRNQWASSWDRKLSQTTRPRTLAKIYEAMRRSVEREAAVEARKAAERKPEPVLVKVG